MSVLRLVRDTFYARLHFRAIKGTSDEYSIDSRGPLYGSPNGFSRDLGNLSARGIGTRAKILGL